MMCPNCHCDGATKVLESREREDGSVMRRRICGRCGFRFKTYEIVRGKAGDSDRDGRGLTLGDSDYGITWVAYDYNSSENPNSSTAHCVDANKMDGKDEDNG